MTREDVIVMGLVSSLAPRAKSAVSGAMMVVFVLLVGGASVSTAPLVRDMTDLRLRAEEGTFTKTWEAGKTGWVAIALRKHQVRSRVLFDLTRVGSLYRSYLSMHAGRLVALEELSSDVVAYRDSAYGTRQVGAVGGRSSSI